MARRFARVWVGRCLAVTCSLGAPPITTAVAQEAPVEETSDAQDPPVDPADDANDDTNGDANGDTNGEVDGEAEPDLDVPPPTAQQPAPVALDDRPEPPPRLVEVGPFFGFTLRPSEDSRVSFDPAFTWGAYVRPEVTSWLGVRLYYRQESIPVSVRRGGYEVPDYPLGATDFQQPDLRLRSFGARLEPTWVVNPRLRLMGILGIAWLRHVTPVPTSTGDLEVQTASRAAVELNTMFGVGASFEVIPHWVVLSASVTYGIPTNRSGTAYEEPVQAFANGERLYLQTLPKFRSVSDVLLSVGLVL